MIGQTIAHYRVTAKLGAGGMGEVYRATDGKLHRDVALKVLPVAFASDADRMARFQREAQVLASLNHPNIAAIYGLEESAGVRALAMELVEGPTLAERIAQGPLPMEEALTLARQIAEALEYAHEHGVIHRDLKPANIKITPDGSVKILDFGLAKAMQGDSASGGDPSSSPTLTMGATRAGLILGTAAYMSPEQAKGKPVDRRADIWAFGVLLYEMLGGKQAFPGETASDSMAAVITLDPSWTALPGSVPRRIRELLQRCLTKDSKSRLRDIGEARIRIEQELAHSETDAEAPAAPGAAKARAAVWSYLPWAVAVLALVAAATVYFRPAPVPSGQPARFSVVMPPNVRLAGGQAPNIAISADGQLIVFVGSREGQEQLYLRRINALEVTPVPGSDGAASPFFSPDGQWIAFFAGGKLKKVVLPGGTPVSLADAPDHRGGAWLADDTIVYSPGPTSGLLRFPASGGEAQVLTRPVEEKNERTHRWPCALPGGRVVLFTVGTKNSTENYDDAEIDAVEVASGVRKRILANARMAQYLPAAGHLVFAREDALYALPFDAERLATRGNPAIVAQGVLGEKTTGASFFSLSQTGTIALVPGAQAFTDRLVAWVDFTGKQTQLPMPPRLYWEPKLSPDGRQIVMDVTEGAATHIWVYDIERKTPSRLTFTASEYAPIWSGDGRRVIYTKELPDGKYEVVWRLADGTGDEEVLYALDRGVAPTSASADGKWLALTVFDPQNQRDIYVMPLAGQRQAVPFIKTPTDEHVGIFSPDGRWMLYSSSETGRYEMYVKQFPSGGGRWQISSEGGGEGRWSSDGKQIIFSLGGRFFGVTVEVGSTLRAGSPRFLFDTGRSPFNAISGSSFSLSRDGKRILQAIPLSQEAARTDLVVATNWAAEVRRATAQQPANR